MRKVRPALAVLLCATLLGPVARAAPTIAVPPGFRLTIRQTIAPGMDRFTFVRRTPAQVVNVVRFAPHLYAAKPVLAVNALGGHGVERTSSMCRRNACLAAMNGDFFADRLPVGGIISNGEVVRTPWNHAQISFDASNRGSVGRMAVAGTMTVSRGLFAEVDGSEVGTTTGTEDLAISGVNVGRPADRMVLYTHRYGRQAPTSGGVDLILKLAPRQAAWRAGGTTVAKVIGSGSARTAIPADGAVLSGHGKAASALADLWTAIQTHTASPNVSVRMTSSPNAANSMGGYPILLSGGRRAGLPGNSLSLSRQPRSMAGWMTNGSIMLATFDGRQPGYSLGVSLAEAAWFLSRIGASSVLNMDGGSSATFVVKGRVVNHPSDRYVLRNGHLVVEQYAQRPGDRFVASIERSVPVAFVVLKR